MTGLPMRSSTTQSAATTKAPSLRREAMDLKAQDHPALQNSEQSSSGNREGISTNFSDALAKNSVMARYDPMIRWEAQTPEDEPWTALRQFPKNQASSYDLCVPCV